MRKTCSYCKQEKDISEFSKNGKLKNGDTRYKSQCKTCIKNNTNKDKALEYHRRWRENNRDHLVDYWANYRLENEYKLKLHRDNRKEEKREYNKNYYALNREELIIKSRRYHRLGFKR